MPLQLHCNKIVIHLRTQQDFVIAKLLELCLEEEFVLYDYNMSLLTY